MLIPLKRCIFNSLRYKELMPKCLVCSKNILGNPRCLSFRVNFKGLYHISLQAYKNAFYTYRHSYVAQFYKQHKDITFKEKKCEYL